MNLIAWMLLLLDGFTKLSKIGPKSINFEFLSKTWMKAEKAC